ncbi:SUMO-conjugating enzyme UBC9-A [Trichoplax sp. H2]|nr:SUMO-conjugating enzyme UBC9-A [Trichoplax sp. H2]|eukprot:RDD46572.1 SUMO-conjugating enzyme UBC9-A [Trichoplax sp. H2]
MQAIIKVDPVERLQAEHRIWKISHPKDFEADPMIASDGSEDWLTWLCVIPGPTKTCWENGRFRLMIYYPKDYPDKPPKCQFQPPLFHPNIFLSGTVALSILEEDWKPTLTIKDILPGIQMLLKEPNMNNPAHAMAYTLHKTSLFEYNNRIRQQVAKSIQNNSWRY